MRGKRGILTFVAVVVLAAATYLSFHLYQAIQMGRVQRTKRVLLEYREVFERFKRLQGQYPTGQTLPEAIAHVPQHVLRDYQTELKNQYGQNLLPIYKKILLLPTTDEWQNALKYESWIEGGQSHYRIGSPGKDDKWERRSLQHYPQNIRPPWQWNFDQDIIASDQGLVQAAVFE